MRDVLQGVSLAQVLAVLILGGGMAATVGSLVKSWRNLRAGKSEDINGAIDRLEKRLAKVEEERDRYARLAARLRAQLVAAGIPPRDD